MTFAKPKRDLNVVLPADAPTHEFPTGKSRFVAYDLEGISLDTVVLTPLSSTALTGPADYTCGKDMSKVTSRAIKPVVQWLDAKARPIRSPDRGLPTVTDGAAGWSFARPPQATKLVIYTVPSEYGQLMKLDAPSRLFGTESVGLAAAVAPQRTLGPATFTVSGTGFFAPFVRPE